MISADPVDDSRLATTGKAYTFKIDKINKNQSDELVLFQLELGKDELQKFDESYRAAQNLCNKLRKERDAISEKSDIQMSQVHVSCTCVIYVVYICACV